ncbi:electron transport complex rnfabcdge type A subunit [Prevotella sp. CAG:485]|nr:electron transport complex rnfabcdge type A subunit [Prevotella sp. CAG:485]
MKKTVPAMYQALGVFLPLITTNCAVLGVAILVVQKGFNLMESITYGVATSIGFTLALWIFAGIREQLELSDSPRAMRGTPLALLCAGLLALAFMGFSGIKIG